MGLFLDILYFLYFLLTLPLLLLKGKWHGAMGQRFGFFADAWGRELGASENIWVHAVSVGEVAVVEGIIKGLRQKYPQRRVVLSVSTRTGHAFALKKYAPDIKVIWAPFDLSMTVRKFMGIIRPVLYVVAETELWPNLFRALHRAGVPIVLVNARISDEAFPRYRMFKWFFSATFSKIKMVCAQSPQDAGRFVSLGADKASVHVAGNLKFDVSPGAFPADRGTGRQKFGFMADDKLLVAASTHPGEDAVVIDAYCSLKGRFPRLRLAIAPRHPERAADVGRLVDQKGLPVFFYGRQMAAAKAGDVIVIDAVGHLLDLYRVADVVFVGKSLGIPRRGGQNPIEPASWGKPVIVGPHMENFRDVMRLFRDAGAVVEIRDGKELARAIGEVLDHPERMAGLGVRARAVVEANRGAAQRTVELIAGVT